MDTVVYGAAAGLGFAAYENLAYLVQHAEMWQSLAALRSVLTVPFHGALGIIAGAYLAIARSGTALGAHRHHRDWARISSRILILFAPVALHAAFDFPLLTLQKNPRYRSDGTRLMLGSASVLIGFSSIAFAVRLVRRVGRHHAPRTEIARERLSQLRRMWALLVVGGGAGFTGLTFVLTSIHHWLVNPDRNVALVLVPIGLISILVGIALLLVTTAVYILGRNRMRTTLAGLFIRARSGLNGVRRNPGAVLIHAPRTNANKVDPCGSAHAILWRHIEGVILRYQHRETCNDPSPGHHQATIRNARRGARALEGLLDRRHPAR